MTCVICNLLPYGKCDYHMKFQDKVDDICDLVCDPESEFYSLASWDESGREATYVTFNAPIAKEIAEVVRGTEALDAHELRVPCQ